MAYRIVAEHNEYIVVEQPPQYRTIRVTHSYTGNTWSFYLWLPYMQFCCANPTILPHGIIVTATTKPMENLQDLVFVPPFPNFRACCSFCYGKVSWEFFPESWRRPSEVEHRKNLLKICKSNIGQFWQSKFVIDIHDVAGLKQLQMFENSQRYYSSYDDQVMEQYAVWSKMSPKQVCESFEESKRRIPHVLGEILGREGYQHRLRLCSAQYVYESPPVE